jgi:hypothetical protein
MWRVELGTKNHVMPTRIPAACQNDEKLLELRERNRIMAGFVGQYAIWDLCAHKKAP